MGGPFIIIVININFAKIIFINLTFIIIIIRSGRPQDERTFYHHLLSPSFNIIFNAINTIIFINLTFIIIIIRSGRRQDGRTFYGGNCLLPRHKTWQEEEGSRDNDDCLWCLLAPKTKRPKKQKNRKREKGHKARQEEEGSLMINLHWWWLFVMFISTKNQKNKK